MAASAELTTYRCSYERYANGEKIQKAEKLFELVFITDPAGKATLVGNQGSSEVKGFWNKSGEGVSGEIRRWIRAFHAALYHEPLPRRAGFGFQPPLPSARLTANGPIFDPLRSRDFKLVETVKLSRAAGTLDQIRCCNDKLKYDCVWDQADNGQWMCIFALDLSDWKNLGDIHNFPARGCVGFYFIPSQPAPALASRGTHLWAPAPNLEPLDPFGS